MAMELATFPLHIDRDLDGFAKRLQQRVLCASKKHEVEIHRRVATP
jgi:hypothetical protein